MSDFIPIRRIRKERPYRQGKSALYDEANGPRNPHRLPHHNEWSDPTGEIAVLRITSVAIEKCITVNGTDT